MCERKKCVLYYCIFNDHFYFTHTTSVKKTYEIKLIQRKFPRKSVLPSTLLDQPLNNIVLKPFPSLLIENCMIFY